MAEARPTVRTGGLALPRMSSIHRSAARQVASRGVSAPRTSILRAPLEEDTMGIALHYAPQTRAVIALWAIEEIGIPYERVKLDYKAGEHRSEAFTKINPNQRVPAMVV